MSCLLLFNMQVTSGRVFTAVDTYASARACGRAGGQVGGWVMVGGCVRCTSALNFWTVHQKHEMRQ